MTTIRKIVTSKVDGNSADSTDTNEIRPFGEIAVYLNTEPNPDKLTLMMFDGIRTHLKSMVLAPGRLYGSDADSGDGNNRDTIKLIPDASLSDYTGNDQYLIVDPTGGNIHIRAGGTIDNSDADLYLGGKQTFVRVSDDSDNVAIRTGFDVSIENVVVDVVDEWAPPGGPGSVWRMFFLDTDYPALGTTVQVGDTVTTSWGTPITAAITNIVQDIGAGTWALHFDQDITAEFNFGDTVTFNRGPDVLLITTRLSKTWTFSQDGSLQIPGGIIGNNEINITVVNEDSSTYTWNFGQTGVLTAPGDITTGTNNGRFIQDCADSNTSMRWINVPQGDDTTQLIRAYTGDPKLNTEVERAQIKLNWDETEDKSGLTIRTFNQTDPNNEVDHDWLFKGDGVLQLPVGGDIVDSEGNSVLGGVDSNIWVQTFETASPATDVPSVAVSVEYDSDGNIIALFSHINPVDDSTYYSVGKYTTTGTRIWTTGFADDFNTDGWGLAVDNEGGFIYIAGSTNADGGEDNATLTKIDGATGLVEWSKIYDFGFSSFSSVVDVTSDGDPVMVGFASNGDDRYVATTKVDQTDGSVIWSRALDGQNDEEAYGMAVGPDGEVVAVGYMESLFEEYSVTANALGGGSSTISIIKGSYPQPQIGWHVFSSTPYTFNSLDDVLIGSVTDDGANWILGNLTEASTGNPTTYGTPNVVTLILVDSSDTDNRMLVVKYAANGTIAWQKAVQFDADFDCGGADADIDSQGNIYVCGQYSADNVDPIGQLMSIVKFNSSGVKQWSRRVVGNCGQWSSSIVVGADDHLYLSATTFSGTNPGDLDINLVLAKYGFDGTVEWQRLLDYTPGYSFGTTFFGSDIGGSNLAVKQDYVAVSLGFGSEEDLFGGPGLINAAVAQISATGDIFTVGNWDFKAASFSGVLNNTASDITVVDAGKTDYDNIANISTTAVTLEEDSSDFLIGTLFTAPGGDNSLVNGAYTVTLENTGTVTLPQGGTITEGYVTSNPTIQLTPASPDVASQKLVIKGGGSYTYTDNGIEINYYNNTGIVGDTLTFYIYSTTYSGQTLYWWINPEGAGIGDTESGTVTITDNSGQINILIDSDDYEFTLRVSPEDHNYDPASLGVESGLINADAPTLDADHHLHLTTGDLTETSIFLGTDNHNVRTTVNGGIEITTPNTSNNVWQFGTDGNLTVPGDIRSEGNINIDINLSDSTLRRWQFGEDGNTVFPTNISIDYSGNNVQFPRIIADSGKSFSVQGQGSTGSAALAWTVDPDAAGQYAAVSVSRAGGDNLAKVVLQAQSDSGNAATVKLWKFDQAGTLTLPKASKISEVIPGTGAAANVIVIQSASSILNTSFATLPPAPISNYAVPGTDIVVNVTWNTNGEDYHSPRFEVVNGGTGHTGGGQFGGGEVLTVPYVDMGISGGGDWTWYVSDLASDVVLAAGLNEWTFGGDGTLTFPDATAQTTAHIQGEQVFTLDTGSTAYAPTVVDFNLLFVTSAVGYSETDPTSVTLPAGVPGQRLVIFNGYNLATLTVNPGPVGRDISSGVVAEFIYSGFDGLWMPLYGTNSPT